MERFLNRYLPDLRTFGCLHREMCASGSFDVSRSHTGTGIYRRIHAVEENSIMHSTGGLRKTRELLDLRLYIGKLNIGATVILARIRCGEFQFKSTKCFYPLNTAAPNAASTLHFRTLINIRNLFTKDTSICIYISDK